MYIDSLTLNSESYSLEDLSIEANQSLLDIKLFKQEHFDNIFASNEGFFTSVWEAIKKFIKMIVDWIKKVFAYIFGKSKSTTKSYEAYKEDASKALQDAKEKLYAKADVSMNFGKGTTKFMFGGMTHKEYLKSLKEDGYFDKLRDREKRLRKLLPSENEFIDKKYYKDLDNLYKEIEKLKGKKIDPDKIKDLRGRYESVMKQYSDRVEVFINTFGLKPGMSPTDKEFADNVERWILNLISKDGYLHQWVGEFIDKLIKLKEEFSIEGLGQPAQANPTGGVHKTYYKGKEVDNILDILRDRVRDVITAIPLDLVNEPLTQLAIVNIIPSHTVASGLVQTLNRKSSTLYFKPGGKDSSKLKVDLDALAGGKITSYGPKQPYFNFYAILGKHKVPYKARPIFVNFEYERINIYSQTGSVAESKVKYKEIAFCNLVNTRGVHIQNNPMNISAYSYIGTMELIEGYDQKAIKRDGSFISVDISPKNLYYILQGLEKVLEEKNDGADYFKEKMKELEETWKDFDLFNTNNPILHLSREFSVIYQQIMQEALKGVNNILEFYRMLLDSTKYIISLSACTVAMDDEDPSKGIMGGVI